MSIRGKVHLTNGLSSCVPHIITSWVYHSGRHVIDFVLMKRKDGIMVGVVPASISDFDKGMYQVYACI
jgi:hypothetical protein